MSATFVSTDELSQTCPVVHQPDVYPFAAEILRRISGNTLFDLGCGPAQKLVAFHPEFRLVGIDRGENLEYCTRNYDFGEWVAHDFEERPLTISKRWDLAGSGVICSDLIEHLEHPEPLLETLAELVEQAPFALISASERNLAWEQNDLGAPAQHVSEWNLDEFRQLLESAGLHLWAAGLTYDNDKDLQKKSIAILVRARPLLQRAPEDFRVTAIVCAFNEADVIEHTLDYLTQQGIRVVVVDNWSTDGTAEKAQQFTRSGMVRVERFPADGPSGTYDWHRLLGRVEEIAAAEETDWIVHHDADEIRESPWPAMNLRTGLYQVDQEGFNCIDHLCVIFPPTCESETAGARVPSAFQHFEFGKRPGHFIQKKAWKKQPERVMLADGGGHDVGFPGRRVYPLRFLLRHYPIRSQEHGRRKVFAERLARFNAQERKERGWHNHYDAFPAMDTLIRDSAELLPFDDRRFHTEYLTERLAGIGILR